MTEETVKLTVEGMSCQHCVSAVQKALEQLSGVRRVAIDLQGKKVEVGYDPEAVNRQTIKETIEGQGYTVCQ